MKVKYKSNHHDYEGRIHKLKKIHKLKNHSFTCTSMCVSACTCTCILQKHVLGFPFKKDQLSFLMLVAMETVSFTDNIHKWGAVCYHVIDYFYCIS